MFEFDPQQTAQEDLRSGRAPWHQADQVVARPALADSRHCDVLIVGAGITGSLAVQHFTRIGLSCCIIDREKPGLGSTAASTSMLQWEIDAPLSELTELLGFERAANIYRRSYKAVSGLKQLATRLGADCALRERSSLYLTAGETGARDLLEEHSLRERAGLPGYYLDYAALNGTFGFDHAAAILSPGSACR